MSLLVRTNPYGEGYEVISGHRRKEAAVWAGEKNRFGVNEKSRVTYMTEKNDR